MSISGASLWVVDGHGELELEIRHHAEAADEGHGPLLLGKLHRERFKVVNGDPGDAANLLFQHFDAFFDGEEAGLGFVDGHRNDDVIEDLHRTLNQVEVAQGWGIKTAGIHRDPFSHR